MTVTEACLSVDRSHYYLQMRSPRNRRVNGTNFTKPIRAVLLIKILPLSVSRRSARKESFQVVGCWWGTIGFVAYNRSHCAAPVAKHIRKFAWLTLPGDLLLLLLKLLIIISNIHGPFSLNRRNVKIIHKTPETHWKAWSGFVTFASSQENGPSHYHYYH